jgi:threonine dehydratase
MVMLLGAFAAAGANLVEVEHLREGVDLHVRETGVHATFEVRSRQHGRDVLAAVRAAGYPDVEADVGG